jgi:uncharacterized membrane protein
MKTSAILLAIGIVAVMAAAIVPALTGTASAAIRDACEKNGNIRDGECNGNTDKNGKDDVRLNPADKAPPGQQDD